LNKMIKLIAKPVVKNKYWIVENNGDKIGTVQAVEDGGYVYVQDQNRNKYATIKTLGQSHNIKFETSTNIEKPKPQARAISKPNNKVLDGYPTDTTPHNVMREVRLGVSVYTKTKKSKSYFCAGYFAIEEKSEWTVEFCPKLITVNRHKILGPYKTRSEVLEAIKEIKHNGTYTKPQP
jgi:hypothetical protein